MSEIVFKRAASAGLITVTNSWVGPLPGEPEKKPSQWIDRARMAWGKDVKIVGDGPFYFLSRCTKTVSLFASVAEMRECKCSAGLNCDPLRLHERGKIRPLPPLKIPGSWEK